MNEEQRSRWKSEALDFVFEAMARSERLTEWLIYKGARILNRRLGSEERQSLDIDSNLAREFIEGRTRQQQGETLEKEIRSALVDFFEEQDPVRYEVVSVRAEYNPQIGKQHAKGWDSIQIRISLKDLSQPSTLGFPRLDIDVAAPESLRDGSVDPLPVGDHEVYAYTLPRLAGEKLRAFLSSLPAYRQKVSKPGEAIRAKDIYDLVRIEREYPLTDTEFWREVASEFRLACDSRYIDCYGIETFEEGLERTREAYYQDKTIPSATITFEEAWCVIRGIADTFTAWGTFPFTSPIPGG